jgi:hypothetical protein
LSPGELWVPGSAQPSLEDFVKRLHQHIDRFAQERVGGSAEVEAELFDGSRLRLVSILPEPGYGFITLVPHVEDGDPEELIVPVGAIARIRLGKLEEQGPFGFAAPSA